MPQQASIAETIRVQCPADGRLVGEVPALSAAEVAAVAAELRAAQPAWEDLGPKGRGRVLLSFLDWILDNEQRLIGIIQSETGKSWGDAALETVLAIDIINYYAKNAPKFLADQAVSPAGPANTTKKLRIQFRPYQLVGLITPWNAPLANPIMDGIAALMAGAALLCKPSEITPLTWTECVRGWREEVDAPGVLASVSGTGSTGRAVVDEVDMIAFTGSTATGRLIAARAGERLIPCSLELGGKDAMIVCADADLDRAAGAAAWGAMLNSGQVCVSVERVYVEAAVYDPFVAKVTDEVRKLRQGMDQPLSFTTDIGSMATASQVDIVERHVQDARAKGARVLTGGKRGVEGCSFEPTVLVDVDHTMACMREETFGPTLPIMKVSDELEAIRLANDSPYGLAASVWTRDADRGDRISRKIEAGSVNINNVLISTFQLPVPMSGWKASGLGHRFGGAAGMLKYCRNQTVLAERIRLKSEPHWYPYKPAKSKFLGRVARLLGAHDWRRRLDLKRD